MSSISGGASTRENFPTLVSFFFIFTAILFLKRFNTNVNNLYMHTCKCYYSPNKVKSIDFIAINMTWHLMSENILLSDVESISMV